ncbi:MAG: hypothetical protein IAG13_09870 [Deltaproteobacteria bacterium]|nr:hypothetical protein [Nannocystaceae bacterium]
MNRSDTAPVSLGIVPGLHRFRPLIAAVTLTCAALFAGPAQAADDIGAAGRLVKITFNGAGSDDAATHHGSVLVRHGSKNELYTWGGTACPASKLTDVQIGALESAFHNRTRTLITPRYKPGDVKDTRCLVGFELSGG